MASWMPAYFQKRLLRTALSRIALLDVDSLDLDSLGVKIGRTSTVELKNVGLHVQELSALLQLPPNIRLQVARVLSLRLTVPANFFQQSIIAEVDGIEVDIAADVPAEPQDDADDAKIPEHRKTNRRIHSPPPFHESGRLPSAQSLARSILLEEPVEEKQELEARYMAKSSLSDTSDDLGTGTSLGLPAMVASFLQGIVDRVQVRIKDVNIRLSLHDSTPGSSPTIFIANLANIQVNAAAPYAADTDRNPQVPAGKRRQIALEGLSVHFVREERFAHTRTSMADLFVSYTSSATSRKEEQKSDTLSEQEPALAESGVLPHINFPAHAYLSDSDDESLPDEMTQSTASFDIRPGEDNVSWADRRSRAPSDHDQIWSSFAPDDDRPASEILQDLSSSVFMSTIDTRSSSSVMSQSTIGQSFTSAQAPRTATSSSFMHRHGYPSPDTAENERVVDNVDTESPPALSPLDSDDGPDLTESVVYSHAEAESMYLSAVGPEPGQEPRSSPKLRALPGGWNSVIDDDEDLDPPFLSQHLNQPSGYESEDRAPTPTLRNLSPVYERQPEGEPRSASLTYVSKEILAVRKLNIGIRQAPSAGKPAQRVEDSISQSSMTTSAFQQAPGAFSIYAEGGRSSVRFNAPAAYETASVSEVGDTMDTTIEVEVTPITLQLDAGTIRSLITLAEVTKSPSQTPASSRSSDQKDPAVEQDLPGLSLQLETISVSLFEELPEASVELTDVSAWRPGPYPVNERRALLQFELQRIDLEISNYPPPAEVGLKIGNFKFTAGTNTIFSFDTTKRQSDKRSARHAITVTSVTRTTIQGQSVRRIEADLLPLHVDLDLVKFDEDFDTLGGMIGIVEMSSSLLSSGYFAKKQEASALPRRGVRFQESLTEESAVETKFGARLEGFDVRLTSKSCALELQALTTKVVHRQAGVKVTIEALSLAMPTTNALTRRSDLDIFVKMVQLVYKPTPLQQDLSHLISLVTPSKNKYENDDDILVDTLIRQRRKGSVLNVHVSSFQTHVHEWEFIPHLQSLGDELSKLSAVTKYLPEDDTPGLLFLIKLAETQIRIPVNEQFGLLNASLMNIQVAHVGLPALTALSVGDIRLGPIGQHDIIHEMLPKACTEEYPMLMLRMVGDEVEPVVKVKLFNICVEYDVPTLLSLTSTETASEVEQKVQDLAASVLDSSSVGLKKTSPSIPDVNKPSGSTNKKLAIDVLIHGCALGLQPTELQSKGLLLLEDTKFGTSVPPDESFEAILNIRQATLYVADHEAVLSPDKPVSPASSSQPNHSLHLQNYLLDKGYVSVSSIRSAQATVCVLEDGPNYEKFIDVELRDEFFLLETCADSTQTLISVLNGLSPPALASNDPKFRPQLDHGLMTLDDMVNSFSGDAFVKPGPAPSALFDAETDLPLFEEESLMVDPDTASDLYEAMHEGMGLEDEDFYSGGNLNDTAESLLEQDPFEMTSSPQFGDDALVRSLRKELGSSTVATPAVIRPYYQDDRKLDKIYGGSRALGEAHEQQKRFPVQVRVREVNIIWNLYDGYDWRRTREAITQAVEEVEMKLEERKSSRRRSNTFEDDAETVIGDCLFNSIYIGVPSAREPADLRHSISNLINQGNEAASETESYATTGISRPSQADLSRQKRLRKKRLRLQRGASHKLGFELKGVSLDFLIHPPGSGEVQSSVDVRVTNFEIFDRVPTSTWKKFLTLHSDKKNMREMMKPMIHLELLNVRPVPELVATEMTIRASVLPLRLHVDQDALEFMTRFFDFKDDSSKPADTTVEPPFIQRLEVNTVSLCLDYKPKKVDYVGLRGGRMSEFKNFVTLEKADIKLKHAIIYGLRGFDTLHDTLSDIWTPDVIHNQLRGVLAGIGMTRPLVELGIGIRDIVAVPVAEIRKDGFKVRSVQKGAIKALSTTSSGFARLIAKVAIGTGTRLQDIEDMLSPAQRPLSNQAFSNVEEEYEQPPPRAVSNYADQPLGVLQGLHSARRYLERDLTTARDAIIAVQGDFMASGTAAGAAKAVIRHAPTILLQPVIGVSRAVGQTFKGVGNQVDREHIKKSEDKYKHH
ncbi:hypothetical protein E4T52_15590 [Aureobasidium sp. EXF-3400]|nr:hypothetical protein E4T51_14731 [Aureobasidium sp. EXF-12344]KAI4769359.1 hypothetical protein E4T52_15590 [Aureobasidium sp. EXF-3400]